MKKIVVIAFLLLFADAVMPAATHGTPPPGLVCHDSRHQLALPGMEWVRGEARLDSCWRTQCTGGTYFDARVAINPPCIPCEGEMRRRIRETWDMSAGSVELNIESR